MIKNVTMLTAMMNNAGAESQIRLREGVINLEENSIDMNEMFYTRPNYSSSSNSKDLTADATFHTIGWTKLTNLNIH